MAYNGCRTTADVRVWWQQDTGDVVRVSLIHDPARTDDALLWPDRPAPGLTAGHIRFDPPATLTDVRAALPHYADAFDAAYAAHAETLARHREGSADASAHRGFFGPVETLEAFAG
ncbi:hypothetical protein GFY24_00785 [Nocardia sp. SYP-A9097]|uniref:hypothetical protein n=1 Tax=Nocardia sp. SYP-A9097 TaxID=2663237 RepID=UPI00129B1FC2|nr:hypothetical protein [Nocardia sp. SYP-A9097]MRH86013.1 hypothetical protein [Nocardia sp. SYP-A9097]